MKNVFKNVKLKLETTVLMIGTVLLTDPVFVYVSTAKLVQAGNTIKGILTALIVIVGGIACAKIVIKYLPSIDDPQEKNIMTKALVTALIVTAIGGALVWIVPWAYGLVA